MATDAEARAARFVALAVVALLNAAQLGHPMARHLHAIATGARSAGRPPIDDSTDLAAIAAGEPLTDVAARRASVDGASYEAVRRRLKDKLRKGISRAA
jgi:hypothetical protein